ncbi:MULTISPECIES: DUF4269 domain-containing protein [Chryseobacterium]|uniref:DUF4269 domain-containing protein n=1 Tax=Chryseobacterium cucumeris TaxID=1813611 RepID=A0ABX9XDX8_9FLAO|nr:MULTISPECIES: DUF4269 domain-containing protein [Chryseobacterium]KYH03836.1 hypothetical protein A1704_20850 [Chryseobacterium cucumeris]MDH5034527.1 DUF4269 domain-containing protein [Chryseobacterium cucumeris]ROH95388.1 DUF4269 domain-containing protein [Chryseobacterium cucumeris]WFB67286.1 DUF4269 domain-containing protein [Chryseobacterium sp. WX]
MLDFTRIDYLKDGNERQKKAYEILTKHRVFDKLKDYSPILAGTVPIEIDIKGSDLDLIFEVDLKYEQDFLDDLLFCQLIPHDVEVEYPIVNGEKCMTLNFMLEGFPIEIFGQNKPTKQQNAYLHMMAEYKILKEKGEEFKQRIIELKKQGIKTEPAFGILLGLENPYEDLLKF